MIKQVSKFQPTGTESFVSIVKNLYDVPTPIQSDQQSKIADLFDVPVRNTVVDGKTFSGQNDFAPETYYGKIVFAHKVIKPNAATINFGGFPPLFTNIAAAIAHHRHSMSDTT